jgi:Leucine-rich repeat (LRR) protein
MHIKRQKRNKCNKYNKTYHLSNDYYHDDNDYTEHVKINKPSGNLKTFYSINLIKLDLSNMGLVEIPDLSQYKSLIQLTCRGNHLTSIHITNPNLEVLDCSENKIIKIHCLNEKLIVLACQHNKLTSLPELPHGLKSLLCGYNMLTSIPKLNDELTLLSCSHNNIEQLPPLNDKLKELFCSFNQLTKLPSLNNIIELDCGHNKLSEIPKLTNNGLLGIYMQCMNNNIHWIPEHMLNNEKINFEFQNNFDDDDEYIISCLVNVNQRVGHVFIDISESPLCKLLYIKKARYAIIRNSYFKSLIIKSAHVINRFRHLYYSIRFKKQFRKWYYERVVEPKIKIMYHPSKLIKLMNELNDGEDNDILDLVLVQMSL